MKCHPTSIYHETFCSFIKSLKIKLKWVCETTGRNTYARVPSRKSSTPPDWDFQTPSPPTFQTLEQKIRHRKCYAFSCHKINNDNMVIWTLFQNSKMTKHLSDDRPPAYDSQIFFPPEIKHHKKDQNASSVSVIYFKTASLLFICSAFMLWFSIYTAWQLFYVTNMAMVKNYCYKFIIHMDVDLHAYACFADADLACVSLYNCYWYILMSTLHVACISMYTNFVLHTDVNVSCVSVYICIVCWRWWFIRQHANLLMRTNLLAYLCNFYWC